MVRIKMEVWKTLGTGRTMKNSAEADINAEMLEVADDLCGSIERCRKNGVKTWIGRASCAAYIDEQAADAEAFVKKHGLDAFTAIFVERRYAGSLARGDWRIDYRFSWQEI